MVIMLPLKCVKPWDLFTRMLALFLCLVGPFFIKLTLGRLSKTCVVWNLPTVHYKEKLERAQGLAFCLICGALWAQ